jgi:hypothetical protein
MRRFSDWLSSVWNTAKNVAGKVGNFMSKDVPIVGSLIGKAAHIEWNMGSFIDLSSW